MIDLAQLDTAAASEAGAEMPVLHPVTGKPLANDDGTIWTLTLVGADSPELSAEQHRLVTRRLNRKMGKGGLKLSAEELDADSLELLVRATRGWKGLILNGQALPFSQQNVRMVYDKYPFIREQANAFIEDRSNFLGNLSRDSSSSPERSSS